MGDAPKRKLLLERTPHQMLARHKIDILESSMREAVAAGEQEQTLFDGGTEEGDGQCQHAFGDGVYARSLLIPAGTCVVGKIHKQARVVIIAQGHCRFVDEFHEQEVKAPWMGEFKPGTKTAVYAFTDTVWVACLATEHKDSREAFASLVVDTHPEYIEHIQKLEEPACP